MTNKEAINNLKFIMDYYKDLDDYTINQLRNLTLNLSSEEIEALSRAIKSLEAWDKIKEQILDEKEFAYADFEEYKINMLGVDPEYVEDELPADEFRYGMERTLEIINKHLKEIEE